MAANPRQRRNEIGNRYGFLVVLADLPNVKGKRVVRCKCDCGKETKTCVYRLRSGKTRSCGCMLINHTSKMNFVHGLRKLYEYDIWCKIKQRCYNKNCKEYKWYGERGIKMCDRWLNSFANFFEDMGKRPSGKHSIDRFPNNNGDYEPDNCRWATSTDQCLNRRSTRWIEFNGELKSLSQWAIALSCNHSNLSFMIKKHGFEKAYNHYLKK